MAEHGTFRNERLSFKTNQEELQEVQLETSLSV